MTNRSLTFFTVLSVSAHVALFALWPATEQVSPQLQECSIEIGMVSLPQVNQDFTRDLKQPQQPVSLNKKHSSALKPVNAVAQKPPSNRRHNEIIQALKQTITQEMTETLLESKDEISPPTAASSLPQPDSNPVTATKAAPLYSKNPAPNYPAHALRYGWEGEVWLKVNVSRSGAVENIVIVQSSDYRVLDQAAVKTVQSWEFEPARIGSETTEGSVRIPIRFRIKRS